MSQMEKYVCHECHGQIMFTPGMNAEAHLGQCPVMACSVSCGVLTSNHSTLARRVKCWLSLRWLFTLWTLR